MLRVTAQSLLLTMLWFSPALAGVEGAEFTCTGPFGRNASHAGLIEAFGAANVTREDVFRGGDTMPMTVVFPNDPERRLVVHWNDNEGRRGLGSVIIQSPAWRVNGAAVGMPIAEVERLNGRPFKLTDFLGSDNDGQVFDWNGGKLETVLPEGCRVGAVFGINDAEAGSTQGVPHDDGLASDNEGLRAADPRLYELTVYFPKSEGGR